MGFLEADPEVRIQTSDLRKCLQGKPVSRIRKAEQERGGSPAGDLSDRVPQWVASPGFPGSSGLKA